jgi:subtilisin family serine protease
LGANQATGTSFSAAFVSGIVALLLDRKPDLTPESVRRVLMETATDLGPKGPDDQFGAGLVDAYRAVSSVRPPGDSATAMPVSGH